MGGGRGWGWGVTWESWRKRRLTHSISVRNDSTPCLGDKVVWVGQFHFLLPFSLHIQQVSGQNGREEGVWTGGQVYTSRHHECFCINTESEKNF